RRDPAGRARARAAGAGAWRSARTGHRTTCARADREVPARPDGAAARPGPATRASAADHRPAAARSHRPGRVAARAGRRRRHARRVGLGPGMKASMQARLEQLERRLAEVNLLLSSENAARDLDAFRRASREHTELSQVVACFHEWKRAIADLQAAEQMRADPEMREFAAEEAGAAAARADAQVAQLQRLLLPRDPNDERNVLLEIRAGTGGDESALFAGALLRMYLRYAERQRGQTEILSASESELGGYKEVIVRIAGTGAYSRLKFESGGHRVQRVPETEAQGRIHTSACTVAVMP